METDPLDKAVAAGVQKVAFLDQTFFRYTLSSIQAGAYLTIVGFVFWSIRENFSHDPAVGKIISSLFFGVGLSTIVFTATELFTSNNFYLALSTLAGRTKPSDTLCLWGVCWVGNFVGAVLVAFLLFFAGLVSSLPPGHALIEGASYKAGLPSDEVFFKGVLANWIVCLAIWVQLQAKEDTARLLAIVLIVFMFLYLGFEHSIANMGLFSIAFLSGQGIEADGMVRNLLWSTLGNIAGGGLGIGLPVWLTKREKRGPISNQPD